MSALKKIFLSSLMLVSLSTFAKDNSCIPPESVVCTISSYCNFYQGVSYVQLKTTYEVINRIELGNKDCVFNAKELRVALGKLERQAEQLKAAGSCHVIVKYL